jgi:hypothetical protein
LYMDVFNLPQNQIQKTIGGLKMNKLLNIIH